MISADKQEQYLTITMQVLTFLPYQFRWLLTLVMLFSHSIAAALAVTSAANTIHITQQVIQLEQQDPNLNHDALTHALTAYYQARVQSLDDKGILTLIDFQKPSAQKRLWVIDVAKQKIILNTLVSHAKNSGNNYATHFSNQRNARQSSLGLYVTKYSYQGKHGASLRLHGLNPGLNNNAYQRAIVIHPAAYVSNQFIKAYGRLGRSWGCFALNPMITNKVINLIKDGTLLYAYYPAQALIVRLPKIAL